MDLARIEQLVDLVSRSHIAELEFTEDGTRVRIVKNSTPRAEAAGPPSVMQDFREVRVNGHEIGPPAVANSDEIVVPAPMHGVFYRAAAPGEPPLVEVGSTIEVGQKICIVEAMKTFIDISAETSGVVLAVLAEDGHEIEAGQPLFRIRLAGPS
ncbi:acetyl-CoA carboxylase biotin carboxyl carrier protein subunit [Bradyrhizobium sp. CB82]|uniref:acetyl-CoA carboxylase biotin carboxyl carrier protein n=1 Tax=Bradyrhizobium sp. CB82 TaxID=3039159 RepID=UPI0024B2435C|nr:biotin/lipoyl-containing protein [Bradyrhizobium sp. CB82]WFU42194.1 acetyl-CoA carboxylase biotin carboxyl carrier protein subunit [Bradyrhizobium sp. CB82]